MARMADRLAGKIALVTGATRGIGKAIAEAYAREGAGVFICARNEAEIRTTLQSLRKTGAQIDGCAGDIGEPADVERLVELAIERYGTIDVLVNNASLLGARVPIATYPTADWHEVLRVNLTGIFLMMQQTLKTMIPRGQGSIINVSSGVGRTGRARWGAYAVSKFGVEGLTQVAADEVRQCGVRINAINPGPTRTPMRAQAYPEEDPLTLPTPEQIAPVFVHFASDESHETGQSIEAQEWLKQHN
jgi:NAD(P)-dependent dehydrogenase (short-subunit alcohol dehydrogenase family)